MSLQPRTVGLDILAQDPYASRFRKVAPWPVLLSTLKRVTAIRIQLQKLGHPLLISGPYNEVLPFILCRTPFGFLLCPDVNLDFCLHFFLFLSYLPRIQEYRISSRLLSHKV